MDPIISDPISELIPILPEWIRPDPIRYWSLYILFRNGPDPIRPDTGAHTLFSCVGPILFDPIPEPLGASGSPWKLVPVPVAVAVLVLVPVPVPVLVPVPVPVLVPVHVSVPVPVAVPVPVPVAVPQERPAAICQGDLCGEY